MREIADEPVVKLCAMLTVHEVDVEHLGAQADPVGESPLRAEAGDPAPTPFFDLHVLCPRRVDAGGGDTAGHVEQQVVQSGASARAASDQCIETAGNTYALEALR